MYSTFCFHETWLMKSANVRRSSTRPVFWIGANFFDRPKQNIKFWFFPKWNRKIISHTLEIQIKRWMNVICMRSQTARGCINCLVYRPKGTMDWPLGDVSVFSTLGGLETPKFGVWSINSSSTETRIKTDFLSSCFPFGLAFTWHIGKN